MVWARLAAIVGRKFEFPNLTLSSPVMYEAANVVRDTVVEQSYFSPFKLDEAKYSSLLKLLPITILCLKFVKMRVFNRCPQSLKEIAWQKCTASKFFLRR